MTEAEQRRKYGPLTGLAFRYRYCSTDTCAQCGAAPGEVCRGGILNQPLTWFHFQPAQADESRQQHPHPYLLFRNA